MKKKAHIRMDGSQSYKKEIRINGHRITKRFSRLADAEHWYSDKKREKELVESGLAAPSELLQVKFSEYAEGWSEKRRLQGKPYSSWVTDRERIEKWVKPVFGERILQRISTVEFENFLDCLVTKEKLSPATRNRVRAVLHKMYNDAKRKGLLQFNPVSNVMIWKENFHGFDYWHSLEECQTYLTHAESEGPAFYVFAVLALNTGARLGELIALQNQDVDLDNRRIHLWKLKEYRTSDICKRTKGGGDRWLGINDEVFSVLLQHRQNVSKPKDFIIYQANGESMHARTIRAIHQRTCKRAGLRVIRVHDLRHTFASHFVMNGGSTNATIYKAARALVADDDSKIFAFGSRLSGIKSESRVESSATMSTCSGRKNENLCHHSATTKPNKLLKEVRVENRGLTSPRNKSRICPGPYSNRHI